jgi:hypothetical protein
MATVRNFEVASDKFDLFGIYVSEAYAHIFTFRKKIALRIAESEYF